MQNPVEYTTLKRNLKRGKRNRRSGDLPYKKTKGSDFPMMSVFINPLASMSVTVSTPVGRNSRSR